MPLKEEGSTYKPLNRAMAEEIDLTSRDPNHLSNTVVKIDFVDVIAEPEGVHSFDAIWKASFTVFTLTKHIIYRLLSTIVGIPMAFMRGFFFAVLSFFRILVRGALRQGLLGFYSACWANRYY